MKIKKFSLLTDIKEFKRLLTDNAYMDHKPAILLTDNKTETEHTTS
jgi:hypothetical protein